MSTNSISINAETKVERLKDVLKLAIEDNASSRAMKYIVEKPDFKSRVEAIATTLVALSSRDSATVVVNGDTYSVTEYKVPEKLVDFVNSGILYGSSDGVGKADPMFKTSSLDVTYTPIQFNVFFSDFNGNQGQDGPKFNLSEGLRRTNLSLEDVQYLEDSEGGLRKLHEGARLSDYICWLSCLKFDELAKYLVAYSAPSKKGVATWLLN